MPKTQKRTISLPDEHASYVDHKVASGDYASVSEVVRAGLRALRERDAAVEDWLRGDVSATYDAMQSHPETGQSPESVFSRVRAHHDAKVKGRT